MRKYLDQSQPSLPQPSGLAQDLPRRATAGRQNYRLLCDRRTRFLYERTRAFLIVTQDVLVPGETGARCVVRGYELSSTKPSCAETWFHDVHLEYLPSVVTQSSRSWLDNMLPVTPLATLVGDPVPPSGLCFHRSYCVPQCMTEPTSQC